MLFNSFQFLLFFPLVTTLYFLLPYKYRWQLLLAASYYFYMSWEPGYLILIVGSTLINYYVSHRIDKATDPIPRRNWLIFDLFINLGLLFTFKYFNFFNDSLRSLFQITEIAYPIPALRLLLPVGISFYTFQTLSYTIDVYWRKRKAEPHLGIFALYVAFFPQLVAGPIERSTHLLPQFYEKFDFDAARVTSGLRLMVWGLFKKMVIADRLAVAVDLVYNDPHSYSGFLLLGATYLFAWQIYCDFSGYSDIAIGASRVLGYDLMENFRSPYFAQSIGEFWQRWHISLSTWFRDYLYIPLGGNRVSRNRWAFNALVVFVVSGLWHGANWTFAVWGALHGLYLLLERALASMSKNRPAPRYPQRSQLLRQIRTFHLATFAWIFFRANSLADAWYIITHFFTGLSWGAVQAQLSLIGLSSESLEEIIIGGTAVLILIGVDAIRTRYNIGRLFAEQPRPLRWALYMILVLFILNFAAITQAQFIYFQF